MTGQPDPEDDNRGAGNRAVIIAVAVLLAIGLFLMHEYSVNQQKETCLIEGHRDCSPVTIIPSQ